MNLSQRQHLLLRTMFLMVSTFLLVLFTIQGAIAEQQGLLTGLVGYYDLDDITNTADDSSGNGNVFTVGGSTVSPNLSAVLSNGFAYDTAGYSENISTDFDTDDISLSFWWKTDTEQDNTGLIGHWQNAGGTGEYAWTFNTENTGAAALEWIVRNTAGSSNTLSYSLAYDDDTWRHIVATYDGTTGAQKIYVDGNPVANATHSGTLRQAVGIPVFFGRYSSSGHDGDFDEIGIWNVSLNQTQIDALYNSGSGLAYPFASPPTPGDSITVELDNLVNGTTIGSVTFNVTGALTLFYYNITSSGFCVDLTGNGSQTNCTTGNGASTYFNQTITNGVYSAGDTATANTSQAIVQLWPISRQGWNITDMMTVTSGSTTNSSIPPITVHTNAGNVTVSYNHSGWYNRTDTLNATGLATTIHSTTDFTNTYLSFRGLSNNEIIYPTCTLNTTTGDTFSTSQVGGGLLGAIPHNSTGYNTTLVCLGTSEYPEFNYTANNNLTQPYNATINITQYTLTLDFDTNVDGSIRWEDNYLLGFNQTGSWNGSQYVRILYNISEGPVYVGFNEPSTCTGSTNCSKQYYQFLKVNNQIEYADLHVYSESEMTGDNVCYITVTIRDLGNNPIKEATIGMWRADTNIVGAQGDWKLAGQLLSNDEGYANFYMPKGEYLRFNVEKEGFGSVVHLTKNTNDECNLNEDEFVITLQEGNFVNFFGTTIMAPRQYETVHTRVAVLLVNNKEPDNQYWYTSENSYIRPVTWDSGISRIVLNSDQYSSSVVDYTMGTNITFILTEDSGLLSCLGCTYTGLLTSTLLNEFLGFTTTEINTTILYQNTTRQNVLINIPTTGEEGRFFAIIIFIFLIGLASISSFTMGNGFHVFMVGGMLLVLVNTTFLPMAFIVGAYYLMRQLTGATELP